MNRSVSIARAPGTLWTRELMLPWRLDFFSGKRRRWNWLRDLPTTFTDDDAMFVHAGPRRHWRSTSSRSTPAASALPVKIEGLVGGELHLVGHLFHRSLAPSGSGDQFRLPGTACPRWAIAGPSPTRCWPTSAVLVNRAIRMRCYVIAGGGIEWRRVEYDVEQVQHTIIDHPELDNRLGDRLRDD